MHRHDVSIRKKLASQEVNLLALPGSFGEIIQSFALDMRIQCEAPMPRYPVLSQIFI